MAPTSRHNALEEDARRLREIITRLTLLRVDHTEYACLKALVLFKAGELYIILTNDGVLIILFFQNAEDCVNLAT